MQAAFYVYCVVGSAGKPTAARSPAGLPGGSKPYVLEAGRSHWLVVSEVPLERYAPPQLEASLTDLEWVAEIALAHDAVVEHFARPRGATVVPMKLFTMFSTAERAVAEMKSRRRLLESAFRKIAGCEEWGVRVMPAGRPAAPKQLLRARTGAEFLAARKRQRDAASAAAIEAAVAAASVFDQLAPIAKDARRRDDVPPGGVPPLLDAAFLVPSAGRARFRTAARQAARACAEAGAEMTLTGPWPAYNFVQSPGTRE